MPQIGAHVSAAGGLHHCFEHAQAINADCIQIFGASPRQWRASLPSDEVIKKFHEARKVSPIKKIFLHASYLVNLATPDAELLAKSIQNLSAHLQIANLLEADGLIYHIGNHKNSTLEKCNSCVAQSMLQVLENAPGPSRLIMENAAGGGNQMGVTPEEIGAIFRLANHPRVKVCIDTAHAFASGVIEKFSPDELGNFKDRCEKSFGLENLVVMHINDSKVPFNKKADRHENIGEGYIGLPAFGHLARDPFFSKLPWILEVPGFAGEGPDAKNIKIAKGLF